MKKDIKILADLNKQQGEVSNSINQLKLERQGLEKDNQKLKNFISENDFKIKSYKDSISSLIQEEALIDEKVKKDKLKSSELDNLILSLDSKIKIKNEEITLQKDTIENLESKKNAKIRKNNIIIEAKKKDGDKEIGRLLAKEKELLSEINIIDKKIKGNLKSLKENKDKLKLVINNILRKQEELDNLKEIVENKKEYLASLKDKDKPYLDNIKELENVINKLDKDIVKIEKDKEVKSEELSGLELQVEFLIRKEDNLKSFEVYVKELASRFGLDYTPFQG